MMGHWPSGLSGKFSVFKFVFGPKLSSQALGTVRDVTGPKSLHEHEDPTHHGFWTSTKSLAVDAECSILTFIWPVGARYEPPRRFDGLAFVLNNFNPHEPRFDYSSFGDHSYVFLF